MTSPDEPPGARLELGPGDEADASPENPQDAPSPDEPPRDGHEPAPSGRPDPPRRESGSSGSSGSDADLEDDDSPRTFRDRLAAEERERRLRRESLDGWYGTGGWQTRTRIKGDRNNVQAAGGSIFNTFLGADAREVRAQAPRLPVADARELIRCWVQTSSTGELKRVLRERPVALLAGRPGSGRLSAALVALLATGDPADRDKAIDDAASGADDGEPLKVGQLLLTDDALRLRPDDLDEGVGYVLDAGRADWAARGDAEVLAHLRHVVALAHCRLVVLVRPGSRLGEDAVEHAVPEATEVFRKHLSRLLERRRLPCPPDWVDKLCADERLAATLGESCPPVRAAEAAHAVAGVCAAEGMHRDVPVYLAGLPSRLREEIRGKLKDDDGTLLERCFLIAAAVLNGLPTLVVSRAALALAGEMEGQRPDEEGSPAPSWEQLAEWLGFAQAASVPAERGDEGRLVRLNRPAQAEATLEAVWEEHPTVREPLLRWLRRLSEQPDQAVRIKAAHAVGRLATFNFDVVDAEFLRPWASSRRAKHHRLAAWAMEAAAPHPQVADRVRGKLRRWARGSRPQRSAAARAYGSSIGLMWPKDALDSFQNITREPRQFLLQEAVAGSLTDLFVPDLAETVLRRLDEWVRHDYPSQRRTAALAFNRLASRVGGPDHDLADLPLDRDDDLRGVVVRLWWNALSGDVRLARDRTLRGAPGSASWDMLAEWLSGWDRLPQLRPVMEDVFRLSEDYRHLAAPMWLHLRLWHAHKKVPQPVVRHLAALIPPKTTKS